MNTAASTHPESKKPTPRPTGWRVLAGIYVDILICGFTAWILCNSVGWQAYWASLALFLWLGAFIWSRDRLSPTAGEFCVGIRYLTSSSSQVVTGIRIIPEKLLLNGWLVLGGVVELTLAILFFSGWTVLDKAVIWGIPCGGTQSLAFWMGSGLAFFLCSGYLLSGRKHALWIVPLVHLGAALDFFYSSSQWTALWMSSGASIPFAALLKSPAFHGVEYFAAWSVILTAAMIVSRKSLVN